MDELSNMLIDEITVGKTLDKLRPDKAAGADDLSPRFLAELKEELCHPVTKIMKASFDTGVVPDDWKTANVCPIFKKGSRSQIHTSYFLHRNMTFLEWIQLLSNLTHWVTLSFVNTEV